MSAWLLITDGYLAETPKFRRFRTISLITGTPEFRLVLFRPEPHEFLGQNAEIPEIPEYLTETPKPE